MKITDLIHFRTKLELPYLAHLTRLQNNEWSDDAELIHSKIKLAEYVLLKEEIKAHISVRQNLIKICKAINVGTFDKDYNYGATSSEERDDYTPWPEYLEFYLEDLKHFSEELNQFAKYVPQMDEILSEGLNKFFPGLQFSRGTNDGALTPMNDSEVAQHRKETFTENKQKSFKVLTHNEAIDTAKEIVTNRGYLKRLIHILQHGSDLTLIQNPN